jgi:hypothetical protein
MAKELGRLSPDQMRLVWQTTQKLLQSGLLSERRPARQVPLETHRVWVINDDEEFDEAIPSFACMEVIGARFYEGRLCIRVQKPRSKCGHYVFNSEFEIEKKSENGAGWAYAHGTVRMRGSGGFSGCQRYAPTPFTWDVEMGPGPFVCYGADGDEGEEPVLWGRVISDYCRARYVLVEYTATGDNAGSNITEYWEGNDPRDCGDVSITYPLGAPLCDTDVVAIWDSNSGQYKAISTPSAMLGDPVTHSLVRDVGNASCGIEVGKTPYRMFPAECEPEIQPEFVQLGESIPVVVAISSDTCGTLSYAYQNINAFLCGSEVEFASLPINFDGVSFVKDITYGPGTCTGSATWTWNATTEQWDLTTPCASGCEAAEPIGAGTVDGETADISCFADEAQTNCGLRLEMGSICDEESSSGSGEIRHVPIALEAQDVVTGVTLTDEDGLTFSKATIYVCSSKPIDPHVIENYECPPETSGDPSGSGV